MSAPHHFFAVSAFHWSKDPGLARAQLHLLDAFQRGTAASMRRDCLAVDFWVFKVPGDVDSSYEIRDFAPVVEGREAVAHGQFVRGWTASGKRSGVFHIVLPLGTGTRADGSWDERRAVGFDGVPLEASK